MEDVASAVGARVECLFWVNRGRCEFERSGTSGKGEGDWAHRRIGILSRRSPCLPWDLVSLTFLFATYPIPS